MIRSIFLSLLLCTTPVIAQTTTVNGKDLALKSNGAASKSAWALNENGYVGTYVRLARQGKCTISVQASGNGARIQIALGGIRRPFDLGPAAQACATDFALPAGTYLLRVELTNAKPATIDSIQISGAEVLNEHSDANAFAAADTYIENNRKGDATVKLEGVPAGTPVHIKLRRHAFHFGVCLSLDDNANLIDDSAPSESDAAKYQQFVNAHFNTIVAGNAGKWAYNEPQPGKVTMQTVDAMLAYGKKHGMDVRMHNLIWGNQQPQWVHDLLKKAQAGDAEAKKELRAAISRRIGYYLEERKGQYIDVDVLNEAIRNRPYWDIFKPDGISDIYAECSRATDALLYTNEYNVFQWSFDEKDKPDPYANWYRREIEQIGVGKVSAIGVQYYADISKSAQKDGPHSPRHIAGALANLAVTGLPICLTEFGVQRGQDKTGDPQLAAIAFDDTIRLAFGTDQVNGFLVWGFRMPWLWNKADVGALLDEKWNPTPAGEKFLARMREWTTELDTKTNDAGEITFRGFYGDYDLLAGGKTQQLRHLPVKR